jgi:hypothetical protein
MNARDIATAKTSELLAFFNANTGGAQVKKFADRATAERRVAALIIEIEAEQNPITAELVADQVAEAPAEQPIVGEFVNCPHCGVHLSNGYTTYDDLRGDKSNHNVDLSDMTHEYMCLGCNGTFGPEVKARAASVPTGKARPAMAESLKLDRRITHVETGTVYANACQVWKAGLVSSSQGDRLSATLYAAAKKGDYVSLTVNGHTFTLTAR